MSKQLSNTNEIRGHQSRVTCPRIVSDGHLDVNNGSTIFRICYSQSNLPLKPIYLIVELETKYSGRELSHPYLQSKTKQLVAYSSKLSLHYF